MVGVKLLNSDKLIINNDFQWLRRKFYKPLSLISFMKRVIILSIIILFLVGFIAAQGITMSAIDNENESNDEQNNSNIQDNSQNQNNERNRTRLTDAQIRKIITARNRFRIHYANQSECPNRCTCVGSVTRCQFENGTREMTIVAGNSGNVIMQVKGINASTGVILYKSENKIYGVFKNNETKEVKILPDQIRERIREKIKARLENQTIELDEDGVYQILARKRARLFGFISVRARVRAEVDSETGEVLRIKRPWWDFLASDENEE